MLVVLIIVFTTAISLIIRHESGLIEKSQYIQFSQPFNNTPQINLAIQSFKSIQKTSPALKETYQTYIYNLTEIGFNVQIDGIMSVVYLAYDTNHGFSLYHNATNLNTIDWKQKIHLVELKFPYIIDYTPQAAIYLNGANFELGNSYTLKLHIQAISNQSITISIQSSAQDILNWVTISVLVGKPEIFTFTQIDAIPPKLSFPISHQTSNFFSESLLVGLNSYVTTMNEIKILDVLLTDQQILEGQIIQFGQSTILSLALLRSGCTLQCKKCTKPYECTICNTNRILNKNNECQCILGYFENNPITPECSKCKKICKQCDRIASHCTECSVNMILSEKTCICKDGYYMKEDESCGQCHETCQTCINNPTTCISCNATQYRYLEQDLQKCYCNKGYYEQSIQCKRCISICKECYSNSQNCTSCYDSQERNLIRINTQTYNCTCKDSFYDDGTNNCKKCNIQCKNCIDTPHKCTSCDEQKNLLFDSKHFKCVCYDPKYNYSSNDLCTNRNLEELQKGAMSASFLNYIQDLRDLSQLLYNYYSGDGYFLYIIRRTTAFSIIGVYDQPIAYFHYINTTYPLNVFELERFFSLFIFDYIENYTQANQFYNYTLFKVNVSEQVSDCFSLYNYQRVEVTPLFILTGIDVLFISFLYVIFHIPIILYKKYRILSTNYDQLDEDIMIYQLAETIPQQNSQWIKWQVQNFINTQFWVEDVLTFSYFWVLENKCVVFLSSLILQLSYPTFNTSLQIASFVLSIFTAIIILYYLFRHLIVMRLVLQKRTSLLSMKEPQILNKLDRSIIFQLQRQQADLNLNRPLAYYYHYLALLKKLCLTMICIYLFGEAEIQFYLILSLHIIYGLYKLIIRPYTTTVRNILVFIGDLMFIFVVGLKINDYYNLLNIQDSEFKSNRDELIDIFIEQGQITIAFETVYILINLILQIIIIITYVAVVCDCVNLSQEHKQTVARKKVLNLDVFEPHDEFRRMLVDLDELEKVKILLQLSRIFRESDIILDEFLEVGYANQWGHYTLSFKNMNRHETLVIYQIQRELMQDNVTIPLPDDQPEMPVYLKPMQTTHLHQYFDTLLKPVPQLYKLKISYSKLVQDQDPQLILLNVQLNADVCNLLKNVTMQEQEAEHIYNFKVDELALSGRSEIQGQNETNLCWLLIDQYAAYKIEPLKQNRIIQISKFILPEIDQTYQLPVYLIAERDQSWENVVIELWYKRLGQFATYQNTQLYEYILNNFLKSIISFT